MKKIVIIFTLFLTLPFILATLAFAANNERQQKVVVLPKDEIVNKDYFAAGDSVTLSGTVNGDAYLAGGNVVVEGTVNGDLIAAGGMLDIRGKVTNDVRVAGGQVVVSAKIDRNLTVAGGSVNITDSAKIAGSVVSGAGNLSIFAPIGKGITIGAGQVTVGNTVVGDIFGGVGQIILTPSAKVSGDLTYWSQSSAQIQPGAQVLGKSTHNLPPAKAIEGVKPTKILGVVTGVSLVFKIISLLSSFIIGLLLLKFFPTYTQRTVNIVAQKPWASLGIGFLTVVLTPIVFVILLITIIGIPIAMILLATFLIVVYFTRIFVSLLIGQKISAILGRKVGSGWSLILGLIIYGIITIPPVIGGIVTLLVVLFGLGAILLEEK
ncbi:hypothetical protein A2Z23_02160, partial [Candidatus Curtissbacteria bacterium RBG_16_39_7]